MSVCVQQAAKIVAWWSMEHNNCMEETNVDFEHWRTWSESDYRWYDLVVQSVLSVHQQVQG